jgi:carbon storage regulator
MLVLSRKPDQSILIDGQIKIKVIHVQHNQVKLGITAPPWVSIKREELLTADQKPEKASAVSR